MPRLRYVVAVLTALIPLALLLGEPWDAKAPRPPAWDKPMRAATMSFDGRTDREVAFDIR